MPSSASAIDTFAYDTTHPDRLVSYNGKPITYDYQGNLRSYDGKTYSWTKGRLSRIEVGTGEFSLGTKNWQFLYNGYGQRVKKIYTYAPAPNETTTDEYITSETTSYIYDHSGRLVEESTTTIKNTGTTSTSQTEYIYDHEGIIGARYNNALYYFKRNLQGDVIEVYSGAGIKQTTFTYDAYGRCTVGGNTFIANRFKIRYRGYYYDTETGLYWVQTRYYNPDWCRWISPDSISYLNPETPHGLNLYLYCANDPINHYDPSGCFAISLTLLGLIIGATIGATVGGVAAYNIARNHGAEGWELFGWIMVGVVVGGIIGGALGAGVGAIATKVTGVIGLSVTKYSIIPIKGTTILGHMPGYIGAAQATGSGYYLVSNGTYDKMVQKGVEWVNNMTYLKDANALGSHFVLAPDFIVREGGTFWKEIQYLIENGIPWEMF